MEFERIRRGCSEEVMFHLALNAGLGKEEGEKGKRLCILGNIPLVSGGVKLMGEKEEQFTEVPATVYVKLSNKPFLR